jgi:hypothetical protein
MKKILFYFLIVECLVSCSLFNHSRSQTSCPANVSNDDLYLRPRSGCPPAAFGAEKINQFLDSKAKNAPHPTAKGDPITGKKTSQKKGIRTGEIEKPPKLTKEQKAAKKRQDAEDKALLRQLKKDEKLAKQQQLPY